MNRLPDNWETGLQRICATPTPILREAVFLFSPVGWKRREMVKFRFKRPELIAQCFGFWLDGHQPVPDIPKATFSQG